MARRSGPRRTAIPEIRPVDVADLLLVGVLLWGGFVWARRARAHLLLLGLAILAAVDLLARQIGLSLTAWLLQGLLILAIVVLVIVFQEDLRRTYERIAMALTRRARTLPPGPAEVLARALVRLATLRRGALVVIPRREDISRHVDGGIELDGRISEPLLLSLFDPHSPGHDGAAIVEGDRVRRFAVHLPLSSDHIQLGERGTRHAAALGLAERCDALVIVVSEERGTISIARDGTLRTLARPEELAAELRSLLVQDARAARRSIGRRLLATWREALFGFSAALLLWAVAVPGSDAVEVERSLPVVVENLPEGFELESVTPPEVRVRFEGRRRDVLLADFGSARVRVDAFLARLGRRTFEIGPGSVEGPPSLEVRAVDPPRVVLSLRRVKTPPERPRAPDAPGSR